MLGHDAIWIILNWHLYRVGLCNLDLFWSRVEPRVVHGRCRAEHGLLGHRHREVSRISLERHSHLLSSHALHLHLHLHLELILRSIVAVLRETAHDSAILMGVLSIEMVSLLEQVR